MTAIPSDLPDYLSQHLHGLYGVGLIHNIMLAYLSGDREKSENLLDVYVGEAAQDERHAIVLREDIHTAIMSSALVKAIIDNDTARSDQITAEVMDKYPGKANTIHATMLFVCGLTTGGLPPEQHDQLMALGHEVGAPDEIMERFAGLRREPTGDSETPT